MSRVVFVADGGPAVGAGHLVRCAALAAALRDVSVHTRLVLPEHAALADAPWHATYDAVDRMPAPSLAQVLARDDMDAVVIDGVDLVEALDHTPAGRGAYRVVIDDGPGRPLPADLVVNPNLTATSAGYELAEGGEVLAGPQWALLGPAYRPPPLAAQAEPRARRLVITCGAADPARLTERFLDGLVLLGPRLETTVVIGPFNPRHAAIIQRCAELDLAAAVAPPDLRAVAESADLALTSLGTTATELAYLGVPNLAAAIDERQLPYLGAYDQLGFVSSLGWHADLAPDRVAHAVADLAGDPDRRRTMQRAGMATVDGRGASRVAATVAHALRTRST